jgi:hypothetical protein
LPQALGEIHEAAVGRQKEEEEPRIRIEERWPISVIIVNDSFMRLIKKAFPVPNTLILYLLLDLC